MQRLACSILLPSPLAAPLLQNVALADEPEKYYINIFTINVTDGAALRPHAQHATKQIRLLESFTETTANKRSHYQLIVVARCAWVALSHTFIH